MTMRGGGGGDAPTRTGAVVEVDEIGPVVHAHEQIQVTVIIEIAEDVVGGIATGAGAAAAAGGARVPRGEGAGASVFDKGDGAVAVAVDEEMVELHIVGGITNDENVGQAVPVDIGEARMPRGRREAGHADLGRRRRPVRRGRHTRYKGAGACHPPTTREPSRVGWAVHTREESVGGGRGREDGERWREGGDG